MEYYQDVVCGEKLYSQCTYNGDGAKFALPGITMDGKPDVIPITDEILSKHVLMLGGIGCGKTNTLNLMVRSLRNQMTVNDVMVVFDTKGDYYREFYKNGDIVISNDDTACGSTGVDYWNLFKEVNVDAKTEENILEISNMLFAQKIERSSQPFFPNAAKDIFSALMLDLCRNNQLSGQLSNRLLRDMFNSFNVPAAKDIIGKHKDLKAMLAYISDPQSGQTLGVISELQQLVREIFVGNFAKSGSLSIRELIKNKGGKVIFVEYDLSFGSTLTPIYKMLIDLAIKQTLCRKDAECGNVFFVLDEFRLLPKLTYLDNGINFGRSLGAKFIVGAQNVGQITDAYGKDAGESILSGFSTQFCFHVNNEPSRNHIKGLYGRNIKRQSFSQIIQTKGMTDQLREGYVIEDSDIASLGVGQAIVGILNFPPFVFQFNPY